MVCILMLMMMMLMYIEYIEYTAYIESIENTLMMMILGAVTPTKLVLRTAGRPPEELMGASPKPNGLVDRRHCRFIDVTQHVFRDPDGDG